MLTLSNRSLVLNVLDPREETSRLGPRYCSGGHVVTVRDSTRGEKDLCTAVEPELSFPAENWTVGQGEGLPDSFAHRPLFEPPTGVLAHDARCLVIGVGIVDGGSVGVPPTPAGS